MKFKLPICFLFSAIFVFLFKDACAQLQDPVNWRFSSKKIDDKTYEIRAVATIEQPWHIYAQDTKEGMGLPTTFTFSNNPLVEITGKPQEVGKPEQTEEEGVLLKYYPGKVAFIQIVKLKYGIKAKTIISGKVDYMACTNVQCLPPASRNFSVSLSDSQ